MKPKKPRLTREILEALADGMGYVVDTCLESWGDDFELTRGDRRQEERLRRAAAWARAMLRHRAAAKES